MLPTIAATVGAAAIAASAVVVPVTGIDDEGWFKAGSGDYSITFTEDTVDFETEGTPDMKLAKIGAASLDSLFADGVTLEGDNAHLAFRAWVSVDGSIMPKYTAIVFESGNLENVMLTWGSSPNVTLPTTDLFKMIEDGDLSGIAYQVEVGHTNTGSEGPTSASVDSISFGDVEYDFGTGADDAPGMPGKGNGPDAPGNGHENNGNGGTPPGQVDKDKNKA